MWSVATVLDSTARNVFISVQKLTVSRQVGLKQTLQGPRLRGERQARFPDPPLPDFCLIASGKSDSIENISGRM